MVQQPPLRGVQKRTDRGLLMLLVLVLAIALGKPRLFSFAGPAKNEKPNTDPPSDTTPTTANRETGLGLSSRARGTESERNYGFYTLDAALLLVALGERSAGAGRTQSKQKPKRAR
uniref:Putative secreted protein n=1 Tax=Anopheles triannulatus TaxID=58253 RepID=A0A2M4B5J1_9DIPT